MKVDGKDTTGWSLSEAVSKIRGPKGTVVALTVLHKGEKNPVEIKVTRDVITVKSVTGWVSPVDCSGGRCVKKNAKDLPSVAYIRLSQFGDRTNGEWINVVNKLYLDIKKTKRFAGIVLDLRNNPGGYLNDAAFIASEFIDSGVVVWQEDGSGERRSISVIRKGVFTSDPLVVLVNRGSASASEIVAGALRDHNRARLVGENTFGKGTIQEPIELGGGASVHVSVAKWLTPNGTWVNGKGLTPDIRVPFDEKQTSGETLDNQLSAAIEFLLNNKESLVINK
jgi:carboxyl-terminal processing protease